MLEFLAKLDRFERKLDRLLPEPDEAPPLPPPPPTEEEAARLIAELGAVKPRETILDFMQRVSPRLHRAEHFKVYAENIERAVGGDLRLAFAAPPQHGKTQVTLHGLAWIVLHFPGRRHAYITYSISRARRAAKIVKRLLKAAGIVVSGTSDVMVLPEGGQIIFTSIDAGLTGDPVDGVAIIDDPYKNREEADSHLRRSKVESSYRDVIETRVHPGASILLLATRWHPQDLTGVLVEEGWSYINLPAVAENDNDPNGRAIGEALFPEMWPLSALDKKRARTLDFTWVALYQGRPRPRGGKVFHEPSFYSKLPTTSYRGAFGVDLAYTAKTSADHSVCLELIRQNRDQLEPLFFIVKAIIRQVEAPAFRSELKREHERKPDWPMLWRCSGTEKGSAQFIVDDDIPLNIEQPPGDKLVSNQDVAIAWNDGRVLCPDVEHFPDVKVWLDPLLTSVTNFTGIGKEVDDPVDALGNAHHLLKGDDDFEIVKVFSDRR